MCVCVRDGGCLSSVCVCGVCAVCVCVSEIEVPVKTTRKISPEFGVWCKVERLRVTQKCACGVCMHVRGVCVCVCGVCMCVCAWCSV